MREILVTKSGEVVLGPSKFEYALCKKMDAYLEYRKFFSNSGHDRVTVLKTLENDNCSHVGVKLYHQFSKRTSNTCEPTETSGAKLRENISDRVLPVAHHSSSQIAKGKFQTISCIRNLCNFVGMVVETVTSLR